MKIFLATLLSVLALASSVLAEEVTIACGSVGQEFELCKKHSEDWARKTGNKVSFLQVPSDADARLGVFFQYFAAQDPSVDVVQIDIVWPGALAKHLLDLRKYIGEGHIRAHFPAIVANNSGPGGKVYAIPFFTDAGVLYYRKDLLEKYGRKPPETWKDLEETAEYIVAREKKDNPRLYGFVWQGRAYEGLTCNALEWLESYDGGTVIDRRTGAVTVNNPRAAAALRMAAGWVGGISPLSVLNFSEEESRGMFQAGNAVFMRNWPYAWKLANEGTSPVKGKVGVTRLPRAAGTGKHAATLGGWNMAVSRYSCHPAQAADLVRYLTTAEVQLDRAVKGAYNPTMASLYSDSRLAAANPFFVKLYKVFTGAVARPSAVTGKEYPKVSHKFWNRVHSVLSGSDPAKELKGLERDLNRLKKRWEVK